MSLQPRQSERLSDGSVVSGQPDHVARAVDIDRHMVANERAWVAHLRQMGIKAAHPDDGWVDREVNKIHLCYPQFNDGLKVGELLALGSPTGCTRIVRVVDTSENRLAVGDPSPWYYHFEEAA